MLLRRQGSGIERGTGLTGEWTDLYYRQLNGPPCDSRDIGWSNEQNIGESCHLSRVNPSSYQQTHCTPTKQESTPLTSPVSAIGEKLGPGRRELQIRGSPFPQGILVVI